MNKKQTCPKIQKLFHVKYHKSDKKDKRKPSNFVSSEGKKSKLEDSGIDSKKT